MARLASELDRRMAGSYRLEQRGNANTAPAQSNGHLQRRSVAKGSGGTSSPAAGRAGQRREHAAATWRGGASGGGDAAVTSKEGRPGALEASGAVREAACTRGTGSPVRARPEGCDVGASTGVQCVRLCYQTHLRYSERCARCQVRRGPVRTVRATSEGGPVPRYLRSSVREPAGPGAPRRRSTLPQVAFADRTPPGPTGPALLSCWEPRLCQAQTTRCPPAACDQEVW